MIRLYHTVAGVPVRPGETVKLRGRSTAPMYATVAGWDPTTRDMFVWLHPNDVGILPLATAFSPRQFNCDWRPIKDTP